MLKDITSPQQEAATLVLDIAYMLSLLSSVLFRWTRSYLNKSTRTMSELWMVASVCDEGFLCRSLTIPWVFDVKKTCQELDSCDLEVGTGSKVKSIEKLICPFLVFKCGFSIPYFRYVWRCA